MLQHIEIQAQRQIQRGMHPSAAHIGTPSLNGGHLDLKLSQICLLKISEQEVDAVKCLKMAQRSH